MRRLPEFLLLAVCIASAWAYTAMPPVVTAGLSWMLPVSSLPADEGPRALAAFSVPVALIILLGFYRWATAASRAAKYEKFADTLDVVILAVIALVSTIHLGLLATTLGWTGPTATIVGIILGASLAVMGNVMPRLRPNAIAGLRTAAMKNDPVAWRNAHASFGRLWMIGGAVVIATALFAPRYALVTLIGAVLISLLLAPLVTRRALARAAALRPIR